MSQLTVEQLKQMMDGKQAFVLLDVRDPEEYDYVNLGGKLIPLQELGERYQELDETKEIVVHCRSGIRSMHAVQFLRSRGFEKVYNLEGGINAWSERIDPRVKRY